MYLGQFSFKMYLLLIVLQIADLKGQAERSNTASDSAWEELRITRKRSDDLAAELAKLKAEVSIADELFSRAGHQKVESGIKFQNHQSLFFSLDIDY